MPYRARTHNQQNGLSTHTLCKTLYVRRNKSCSRNSSITTMPNIDSNSSSSLSPIPARRIAVFCGSASGQSEIFSRTAYALGKALAEHNMGVVYGGSNVGLMGAVADGALAHQGEVIGILPDFMQGKEIAHEHLTRLIVVETMHERKMMMSNLADGVLALPGGFGTLDELFEMLTWAQLGLHAKPIVILNVDGFYNALLACLATMVEQGFLHPNNAALLAPATTIEEAIALLDRPRLAHVSKWMPV
jgi:uncharacterized protein (TIGR00730 family)